MNTLLTVEVADFVEAVDAALADLPNDVRTELLEDLPAHLADVLADGGTPLDRLGEPAAYAAELRGAAGYPPADGVRGRRSAAFVNRLAARLHVIDHRVGRAIGYPGGSDLLRALQPAWWVLRGYLALLLVSGAWERFGAQALTPYVYRNEPLGCVVLVALIAASVWIGRRTRGSRNGWIIAVSSVLTIVLVVTGTNALERAIAPVTYVSDDSSDDGGLAGVDNLYPVAPDGSVLRNVRLYDQNGQPIHLDDSPCADGPSAPLDANGNETPLFPVVCASTSGPFSPGSTPQALPSSAPPSSATPSPSR